MQRPSRAILPLGCVLVALATACSRGDSRRTGAELAFGGKDTAGTFLVLSDGDTMATERYQRLPGRVRGTLVHGDGTRVQYDALVAPDESISRLELRLWRPGSALDSRPAQQSTTELVGARRDSLVRTDRESGPARVFRIAVPPGSQPYLIPSIGLAQQALRRARALGGATVDLPIVVLNGAAMPQRIAIRWLSGDSVELGIGGNHVRLAVDAEGRIRDGSDPALGYTVKRLQTR